MMVEGRISVELGEKGKQRKDILAGKVAFAKFHDSEQVYI